VFLNENNPTGAEPVPGKYIFFFEQHNQVKYINLTNSITFYYCQCIDSGFLFHGVNDSLSFQPGKTYRLRLINMSGFSMFYFSIDNHTLDIIEIDGVETKRTSVDSVYLTAAQRVSVLVTAKNTTDTNYWIRADMNTDMFDTLPDALVYNLAVPLYYNNQSSNFADSTDVGMASTFDDAALVPLAVEAAAPYDHQVNLTFNFDVTTDGINRGMFNELPYLSPKVPSLFTLLSEGNHSLSEQVYGPQTQAKILKHLDNIEIVLNNLDSGAHPCKCLLFFFFFI
jgi:iron transport multicopper oxidase